ncbi:MAG TPA: GMC family oxidoreductase [Rhizomicrobium sp.]|jgi:choline dehydrogenase-like flavoprotein|nr:GMC family oxidoreductase [Rhizomicrobium sp.]
MIRNGKDITDGTVISTDVCIIGTGPAGVTAAWLLQKAGLKVTLIEGSRDFGADWQASWPDKVKLYNGTADGLFATNEREFLILPYVGNSGGAWERERVYGGTSAHWGGQSRPLDPITFDARPGFPGWPISREELEPYYVAAAKFCKLYSADFSADYWAGVLNAEVPHLDGFDAEMYQFIGPDYLNFSTRTFDGTTIGDSAADVILNASLLNIDHAQGSVRSASVASMNDQSQKATAFTIQAEVFVLACGAVANARQLLLSNAGNEHDQVGRYFSCHPLSRNVRISAYNFLTPGEARLMNGQMLVGARDQDQWRDSDGVTVSGRFSPTADQQRALGIGSCWFWASSGQYYFEMAPNPESRVTLAETTDPVFRQRQTHITWQLSDLDERTFTQTTQLFKAAVAKRGGTTSIPSWEAVKSSLVVNGHHIGTTRMSSDPATGVVDKNLKVHSLDNLYVAGSSVFASAGVSNPTFSIITLSIRLAEHLGKALSA